MKKEKVIMLNKKRLAAFALAGLMAVSAANVAAPAFCPIQDQATTVEAASVPKTTIQSGWTRVTKKSKGKYLGCQASINPKSGCTYEVDFANNKVPCDCAGIVRTSGTTATIGWYVDSHTTSKSANMYARVRCVKKGKAGKWSAWKKLTAK